MLKVYVNRRHRVTACFDSAAPPRRVSGNSLWASSMVVDNHHAASADGNISILRDLFDLSWGSPGGESSIYYAWSPDGGGA
ncbi:hypothetical protein EVAR_67619_1 [Eumeta japonica]|uniref:Uncharacterized protein n=1 Tax=Eumeta variegata TaxID=151549 RepID=A0A4C1STP1_EUMVA|nr:hypothetical protein EVAR_67619_1 [Eumeta japonica]